MNQFTKATRTYLLREMILILLLAFFLVFTGTQSMLIDQNVLIVTAGLFTLLAAAWLIAGQRARIPLGKPLLIFMAAFVLATVFSSDPRRSFTQLAVTAAGLLLFALAADLVAHGWPAELFAKAILAAGTVMLAIVWVGTVGWYMHWLEVVPGAWLPGINYRPYLANIIVMLANTMLMLALARLLYTRALFPRLLLAGLILALLATIFITSSRGGWLGTATGIVVLAGLAYLKFRPDFRAILGRLKGKPWIWAPVGLLLAVALYTAAWLALKQLSHPTHGPALLARKDYWTPAWHAFLQSPILGKGPYTYAGSFLAENSAPYAGLYVHGHSAFLNLLAEMGLIGGLAALPFLFFLWKGLKCRLQAASGLELALVIGTAASVVAMAVQTLFDCFHTDPLGILSLLVILGAALSAPTGTTQSRPHRPYWILPVILVLWAEIWLSAPLQSGVAAANRQDLRQAETDFIQAVRRDPGSVIAHQQLSLVESVLAQQGSTEALQTAIHELETTIRMEPAWALNHANLGALYLTADNLPAARSSFEEATRRAPNWALAYLDLGQVAEQQGDQPAAISAYQKALQISPDWQAAYFWRSTPLRQQAQAGWLSMQPAVAVPTLEQMRAEVAAYPQTSAPYLQLARAELAAGNWQAAEHPLKLASLTWLEASDQLEIDWLWAEYHAAAGDVTKAVVSGSAAVQSYLSQGLYGPGTFGSLRYAPFMFRRPAMATELVPQLAEVPMTDLWAGRVQQLIDWQKQTGQDTQALSQVLRENVPDRNP